MENTEENEPIFLMNEWIDVAYNVFYVKDFEFYKSNFTLNPHSEKLADLQTRSGPYVCFLHKIEEEIYSTQKVPSLNSTKPAVLVEIGGAAEMYDTMEYNEVDIVESPNSENNNAFFGIKSPEGFCIRFHEITPGLDEGVRYYYRIHYVKDPAAVFNFYSNLGFEIYEHTNEIGRLFLRFEKSEDGFNIPTSKDFNDDQLYDILVSFRDDAPINEIYQQLLDKKVELIKPLTELGDYDLKEFIISDPTTGLRIKFTHPFWDDYKAFFPSSV